MKKMVAFAATLFATSAYADVDLVYSKGHWETYAGTSENGTPACVMSAPDDTRYFGVKFFSILDHLVIHIGKRGWDIPKSASMTIRYEFDRMGAWTYEGAGVHHEDPETIEITVPEGGTATFFDEFARASVLRVQFPGSEPMWEIPMSGSAANLKVFLECVKTIAPQPFTTQPHGTQPHDTQPHSDVSSPTQPFSDI